MLQLLPLLLRQEVTCECKPCSVQRGQGSQRRGLCRAQPLTLTPAWLLQPVPLKHPQAFCSGPEASCCAGRVAPSWGKDLAGPGFPVPKPSWSREGGRGSQAAEPEVPAAGRSGSWHLCLVRAAAHLVNRSSRYLGGRTRSQNSPVDHPRSCLAPKPMSSPDSPSCPPLKGETLSG